jgi:hypothetical protein
MAASKRRTLAGNLVAAFSAQAVALLSSLVMSLVVPKVLGIEAFGYWQLFIFYCGYVGFFHFGLNDGIYLRLGGADLKSLDNGLLAAQFRAAVLIQTGFALIIIGIAWLLQPGPDRLLVILGTGAYLVTMNAFFYLGMIFQATNHTRIYSKGVIIDKVVFLAVVIAALAFEQVDYRLLMVAHIICRLIALGYFFAKGRALVLSSGPGSRATLGEMWVNVKVGVNLMIANIAGSLVLGIGRQFIDMRWGISSFGKVSLALAVTVFFLQFLQQVSLVLYPALRQTTAERQAELAVGMRGGLDLLLPVAYLAYLPASLLLSWWLPDYTESFFYLGLLMPVCVYDGKTQILVITYLKVLRREKQLLWLNAISLAVAALAAAIAAYLLNSVIAVVAAMSLAVIIRCLLGEWLLAKTGHARIRIPQTLAVLLLTAVYLAAMLTLPTWWAFAVITAAYLLFLALHRKVLVDALQQVRR